jgi:hypothetical protein
MISLLGETPGMDWLLEIIWSIFRAIFDLARKATLRDKSRPRWFNYTLAVSYYVLPLMLIVSLFISWKMTIIVAGAFIASLIAGAVTEADDIGAQ